MDIKKEDSSNVDIAGVAGFLDGKVYVDRHVKERLLEFVSLRRMDQPPAGRTILCLLSASGMGKAFIVKSLCEALSFQCVSIPIGEMRDDRDVLLGTRRSDLNATAGRIVHALKEADDSKPVIVLLENLDKTDLSGAGSASAGFFEVLDYMQDFAVRNQYLSGRMDLARVIFIATAANLSTIPSAIREQMEVLAIPSYTENQKLRIATGYLIPGLLIKYGMQGRIIFSGNALKSVIRNYTRESGVAELSGCLTRIIRKLSGRNSNDRSVVQRVSVQSIRKYLGPAVFNAYSVAGQDVPGIVTILGKSEKGGYPLTLELVLLKGTGNIIVTGNTDKMLQESAMVAVDYVRSRCCDFNIQDDFFKQYDIHIHLLEGSTPKYGVSAGLAIAVALLSALLKRPVRPGTGMTGEVSLHGRVFGVRDIRDKVIGALQSGITTIILPGENEPDLRALPRDIRASGSFILVNDVETALHHALAADVRV
jgi:ATP-dependent Lon protease